MFLSQLLSTVEYTPNFLQFCVLVDFRIRQEIRTTMKSLLGSLYQFVGGANRLPFFIMGIAIPIPFRHCVILDLFEWPKVDGGFHRRS